MLFDPFASDYSSEASIVTLGVRPATARFSNITTGAVGFAISGLRPLRLPLHLFESIRSSGARTLVSGPRFRRAGENRELDPHPQIVEGFRSVHFVAGRLFV